MSWRTIKKYLDAPAQGPAQRQRKSKLDPFKTTIAEWLEKDPSVTAAVIEQKLRPLGYRGGHTILREYVHTARPQWKSNRAFLRMEPPPGERFEVDWGHFGTLDYAGDKRKLYAFALVEAHRRMLYLEFTHSQTFETFVRCHVHAFTALGGVAREIAYDNLATAVAEVYPFSSEVDDKPREIVGVVGDVKTSGLAGPAVAERPCSITQSVEAVATHQPLLVKLRLLPDKRQPP
jgi:transposase